MVLPRDDEPADIGELVAMLEKWRAENEPLLERVRRELDEDIRARTEAAWREAFEA